MNTDTGMNRKMISLVALVLTFGCSPLVTTAWGSIIMIDSIAPANPFGNSLTNLGTLDWALPRYCEKNGGTAIVTYNGGLNGNLSETPRFGADGNTWFIYDDGALGSVGGTSNFLPGSYEYEDGSYFATINLPAGSTGTIMVWCSAWSMKEDGVDLPLGTVTATLNGSIATDNLPGDGVQQKVVLNYSTATAQALIITLADTGKYGNAGFSALAVTAAIPEPVSAVLLAAGLMVLLPSAWRKRK